MLDVGLAVEEEPSGDEIIVVRLADNDILD